MLAKGRRQSKRGLLKPLLQPPALAGGSTVTSSARLLTTIILCHPSLFPRTSITRLQTTPSASISVRRPHLQQARMRPSLRLLNASIAQADPSRLNSTGFIGLGRMGAEMAYNLFSKQLAQFPQARFVICDAFPETTEAFRQRISFAFPGIQIEAVSSPEMAVRTSHTVITMLPSSPHVKQVYQGENGILAGLGSLPTSDVRHTLCIDSTTLDVDVARDVAAQVFATGAQMVDAPVSGGVTGAKAGTLSFLVGGPTPSYDLAHPILAHMGKRIIHCGTRAGSGLGAKICNNLILGAQQIAVAEAMLLGTQRLGLKPDVLASVINSSTGACWASKVNNPVPGALIGEESGAGAPQPPCERDYEGGFATALMIKDMSLGTALGDKYNSPLPLAKAAELIYEAVVQTQPELAKKDFSSVYVSLKDLAIQADEAQAAEAEASKKEA